MKVAVAAIGVCVVLAAPASATAAGKFAPVNRPGPKLSVPGPQLKQSLNCADDLRSVARRPILLIPPTLANPDEAFFGFEAAFRDMGFPYCTVTIPHHTTIDIQISGEYVVNAIRTLHRRTGRRVQIVGWSQGAGPEPRWAIRFWPDIRPMIDDLVGLEAPNHGSLLARLFSQPALRQQTDNANFIEALNSRRESFAGISYTDVYSHTSQFVQPNLDETGTTSLHGGGGTIENVATQEVCPLNVADHLAYYYDPVGYALTIDALTHRGPADPGRIDASKLCTQLSMPYIEITDVPTETIHLYNLLFVDRVLHEPQVSAEPPLRCYVFAAGCG